MKRGAMVGGSQTFRSLQREPSAFQPWPRGLLAGIFMAGRGGSTLGSRAMSKSATPPDEQLNEDTEQLRYLHARKCAMEAQDLDVKCVEQLIHTREALLSGGAYLKELKYKINLQDLKQINEDSASIDEFITEASAILRGNVDTDEKVQAQVHRLREEVEEELKQSSEPAAYNGIGKFVRPTVGKAFDTTVKAISDQNDVYRVLEKLWKAK